MINRTQLNKIALRFVWGRHIAIIAGFFWEQRSRKIAEHLLPYLSDANSIIDIGSGSGMISKTLSGHIRADFTLVDVINWNITKFPLILFDGWRIPLSDKKFDVALIIDVLHHSEKEDELIKEALRVSKKVIIAEEINERKAMNLWENFSDHLQWFFYGMPIGIHKRNKKEWIAFLQNHSSCSVRCVREYRNHAIFIAE